MLGSSASVSETYSLAGSECNQMVDAKAKAVNEAILT